MERQKFSSRLRLKLLVQGGWLFLLGLIVGLYFTFVVIGHIEIWPLPKLDLTLPGSEAAWRRAHLGVMFNAITILVFAAAARSLNLSPTAQRVYIVSVALTGWGNSLGFLAAAISDSRGLVMGQSWGNSMAYLGFALAAITAFVQVGLLLAGARSALKADKR